VACKPVNFGGRTEMEPCLGWLGCDYEDYSSVRRVLAIETNALIRALNAFNAIVGTKTNAERWSKPGLGYKNQPTPPGIVTWDGPTNAAWYLEGDATARLTEYPDSLWDYSVAGLHLSGSAPIVSMLKTAMAVRAATCDVEDALVAAGQLVPQQEAPPPEAKSIAREALDFARDLGESAGKGLALLAGGTVLAILGYNYATRKGKNRW